MQAVQYMLKTPCINESAVLVQQLARMERSETLRERYLRVFAGYCLSQSASKVFIMGHEKARDLLPYYRPGKDVLFATVREPTEILSSLVAYRVYQALEDSLSPDAEVFLQRLNLDSETFRMLAEYQPKQLTERILQTESPPSLAEYLSADEKTDCNSVWSNITRHTIFIAHMNEQGYMLQQLFGGQAKTYRENSSAGRSGLAADFMAAVDDSWLAPFLDQESISLYQKLVSSGVIGFWQKGGTMTDYRNLLRDC